MHSPWIIPLYNLRESIICVKGLCFFVCFRVDIFVLICFRVECVCVGCVGVGKGVVLKT